MARAKPRPTAGLEAALNEAHRTCLTCEPHVEYFEKLAQVEPGLMEQANDMRVKLEHLKKFTQVGLDHLPGGDTSAE